MIGKGRRVDSYSHGSSAPCENPRRSPGLKAYRYGYRVLLGLAVVAPLVAVAANGDASAQTAAHQSSMVHLSSAGTLATPHEVLNDAYGMCLDANVSGDGTDGDKVQLWHCTGKPNQLWTENGAYAPFINAAHGLCLDANASGDDKNGDKVQLWKCNGHTNQLWVLNQDFLLYNSAHNLCLDANTPGDGTNGDKVQLWHCYLPPRANQSW